MPKHISGPVGRGGRNFPPSDVMTVQYLLNCVPASQGGPTPELVVDGAVGPKTIAAIENYQRKNGGFADGRVDPGGNTLRGLQTRDPYPNQPLGPAAAKWGAPGGKGGNAQAGGKDPWAKDGYGKGGSAQGVAKDPWAKDPWAKDGYGKGGSAQTGAKDPWGKDAYGKGGSSQGPSKDPWAKDAYGKGGSSQAGGKDPWAKDPWAKDAYGKGGAAQAGGKDPFGKDPFGRF